MCHAIIETEGVREAFSVDGTILGETLTFKSPSKDLHTLSPIHDGWRYQKHGEAELDFQFRSTPSEGTYRIAGQTLHFTIRTIDMTMHSTNKYIHYQLYQNDSYISTHTITIQIDSVQEA